VDRTGGEPNVQVTTVVAEVLHSGGVLHARVTGLVAQVIQGEPERRDLDRLVWTVNARPL
jgi:hypothetical protein